MEAMLSIGAAQAVEVILPFLQSSATAVSQAESVMAAGGPRAKTSTVSWARASSPLHQSKQKHPEIALVPTEQAWGSAAHKAFP